MMISLVMPFYMNGEMLLLQMREWLKWSPAAKAQIEIILVDDGSPQPALHFAKDWLKICDRPVISIYRVQEDRPWHQHAARNLGAKVARAPWLLLTDMDHVLTASNADALLKRLGKLDHRTAYFLHRIEADTLAVTLGKDGKTPKPHPNSFVMTKDLYWEAGGYDEDFCGIYGTDGLFKSRLFSIAKQGHLAKVALIRYWRDIVRDASTTTLPRKEGRKPGDKQAVLAAKAARGEPDGITTLNFPWLRVI